MEIVEVKEEQPPKRIKTDETAESKGIEEDRISALPDCLIIEILSRLPSTKYAIRTSSLSKRWTHLWLSVPTLIFLHENQSRVDFFVSVDKTLTQYHCQSKLKKFKINPWYDSRFESHVNSWIRHVVNRNVEDLCLGFQSGYIENNFFVLKEDFFFASSCFTHLELGCCKFNPSGPISWKNLTSLYISFGQLGKNLIQNILSGSPLLETLNLHKCYGFQWLNITSKSVKNLVLSGYTDPRSYIPAHIIGIDAPNILSLVIEDHLILRKLVLLNVSSLLNVELNYTQHRHYENTQKIKKDKILKGLLLSLRHVKQIKIGTKCYEAFFHLEAEGFKFPSNVKVPDSPQVAVWSD